MNRKQQLKKQIAQNEIQLKRLMENSSKSELCDELCNSLILKKAVLKKELDELNKNKIVEKIKKIIPKKEKLICDYFN